MPAMKPGRVTRTAIDFGSWQSTHEIGCWTRNWTVPSRMVRASEYGTPETDSKPFVTPPFLANR